MNSISFTITEKLWTDIILIAKELGSTYLMRSTMQMKGSSACSEEDVKWLIQRDKNNVSRLAKCCKTNDLSEPQVIDILKVILGMQQFMSWNDIESMRSTVVGLIYIPGFEVMNGVR